ncbi:uncharacterized protein HKW66_Vig0072640 [Vigna angularis]|uniref:Fiber protein Fb11 n=1 Tax=Phaseolus angularis TaxID=3914 RepID=A0A8T0K6P7_PHAAN|nr:uncharacterized protein HKW66_Vig0072640 [Vigna angularis]
MAVMEKLKMFVVQEPVVAASCLIAGFGLFLPAVVRPMLDSYQATKQPPQPALSDNDCRAMAGYALVVASTALQSHCQWVSPYHTHEEK